jgi:hypothetical protein
MTWFIAKLVFSISTAQQNHKPQFDEQLRLISAENTEEAFLKARALGLRGEDSFLNDINHRVRWEFINVSEIVPLGSLEDGTEVYSRVHETEEAKSYIQGVHQRAIFLRLNARSAY